MRAGKQASPDGGSVFSRSSRTRCRGRRRRREPEAGGGEKPFTLVDEEAWIRSRVDEKPDITGRELLAELNQRGIEVSY
jgi:hypothetical protein